MANERSTTSFPTLRVLLPARAFPLAVACTLAMSSVAHAAPPTGTSTPNVTATHAVVATTAHVVALPTTTTTHPGNVAPSTVAAHVSSTTGAPAATKTVAASMPHALPSLRAISTAVATKFREAIKTRLWLKGSIQRDTYMNPSAHLPGDFADPSIARGPDGYFHLFATQGKRDGKLLNIQRTRSRDGVTWEAVTDALPVKPVWADTTQDFWAPHIDHNTDTGKWVLYYAAKPKPEAGFGDGMALGVAVSDSPTGDFVDIGHPLRTGPGFENIDAMSFRDPASGKRYLYWGSGEKPIQAQELRADGLGFVDGSSPSAVLHPNANRPYERLLEAPWVIHQKANLFRRFVLGDKGKYYMFTSGDNCCGEKAHYAVMVAVADSPLGPFKMKAEVTGAETSAIYVGNDRITDPGHNGVFTDDLGRLWNVSHGIQEGDRNTNDGSGYSRRPLLIDPIGRDRDGFPTIAGGSPSIGPQRGPATLVLNSANAK